MSTTFPRARRPELGYNVEQVEDFLEEARRAYGAAPGELTVVTAESIRHTAFGMQKGGYSTKPVDAALERLEDAVFVGWFKPDLWDAFEFVEELPLLDIERQGIKIRKFRVYRCYNFRGMTRPARRQQY